MGKGQSKIEAPNRDKLKNNPEASLHIKPVLKTLNYEKKVDSM